MFSDLIACNNGNWKRMERFNDVVEHIAMLDDEEMKNRIEKKVRLSIHIMIEYLEKTF